MEQPIPPEGYKLVKGQDIKDRVPEGAKIWEPGDKDFDWFPTSIPGRSAPSNCLDLFYAIPSSPDSITDEAKAVVSGERAADYGDVNESFARIAQLWSAYTGVMLTDWDVAQMMILLKVSRAKTSRKRDTLVDIVGYAECASKLEEPK